MGEEMICQEDQAERLLAWQINEEQILDVQPRGFWLTHLMLMVRLDIFVGCTGDKPQTISVLNINKEEVVLKSQVMMMRIGLSCYQI
jgi:hypothetical protein